jgi:hypothetical protein
MNRDTNELEWLTLCFQIMKPLGGEAVKRIAVLGHGKKNHEGDEIIENRVSSKSFS